MRTAATASPRASRRARRGLTSPRLSFTGSTRSERMAATAYIALGGNLGDRQAHLDQALAELRGRPAIEVVRTSSVYETAPVGGPPGQGPYLNAVAELRTGQTPEELLRTLLSVESALGRVRAE